MLSKHLALVSINFVEDELDKGLHEENFGFAVVLRGLGLVALHLGHSDHELNELLPAHEVRSLGVVFLNLGSVLDWQLGGEIELSVELFLRDLGNAHPLQEELAEAVQVNAVDLLR